MGPIGCTLVALPPRSYNVLLTTYEFVMKDKSFLRRTHWQFIIIGEEGAAAEGGGGPVPLLCKTPPPPPPSPESPPLQTKATG